MANHGGFGVAVQLSERCVNDALWIMQRGGVIPKRQQIDVHIPDPNGTIHLDLYIDAPKVSFVDGSGFLHIRVRTYGTLVINAATCDSQPRQVRMDYFAHSGLEAFVEEVEDPVPPGLPDWLPPLHHFDLLATFRSIEIVTNSFIVAEGPDLPPLWSDFFVSGAFRAGVALTLMQELQLLRSVIPPDLAPILNELHFESGAGVLFQTIVGDGIVTLAGNVSDPIVNVSTSGDAGEVTDFLDGRDVGLIIDTSLRPLLRRALRRAINAATDAAEVTTLTLAFHNGYMSVEAHAEADAGDADISFRAVPMLQKPGWTETWDDEYGEQYTIEHPGQKRVWFDLQDVAIDTSLDPGVWVGIIFGGVIVGPLIFGVQNYAMVVHSIVRDVVTGIGVRVVEDGQASIFDTEQNVTLSGTNFPIEFKVKALEVFSDRIQCLVATSVDVSKFGNIVGPTSVSIHKIKELVTYWLRPAWHRYDPEDPEAQIIWTVSRGDTNALVKLEKRRLTDESSNFLELKYSSFGTGYKGIRSFKIGVRVVRVIEGEEELIWNDETVCGIADRLDRSHRYVRWSHLVVTPDVIRHSDGQLELVGKRVFTRSSNIHRTRWPDRCAFADRYSGDKGLELEHMDDLPFPLEELVARRGLVCDYCFFGGPDKDEPLVKPPKHPGGFGQSGNFAGTHHAIRTALGRS